MISISFIPVSVTIVTSFIFVCFLRQYRFVRKRDAARRRIQKHLNSSPPNFSLDPLDHSLYWYPVAFSHEVSSYPGQPYAFSLLNQPLCLYRRNDGEVICVLDLCPHRSAPLSLGQLTKDGNLECIYHGWQYGSNGQCVLIPSVSKTSNTPNLICARTLPVHEQYGYVWVWPGKRDLAHSDLIPHGLFADLQNATSDYLLSPEYACSLDIPYELMFDNLLDMAHVDFTHDGTIGKRSNACCIRSERIVPSPYLSVNSESVSFIVRKTEVPSPPPPVIYSRFNFIPPCFVRLDHHYKSDRIFSQIFIILPSGENRMRLLNQFYRNFAKFKWIEYIPSFDFWVGRSMQKIIDQDVLLLNGIDRNIQQMGAKPLGTTVSADEPIKAFRRFQSRSLAKYPQMYCKEKSWADVKGTKMNNNGGEPTDIEDIKID